MESKFYSVTEYEKIVEDLLKGNVVGFPTDPVYGLAIVYDDVKAFNKLYQIKNRSILKPISMMVANKKVIDNVAYVNNNDEKVIDKLLPGALTIILKAKEGLPEHVTFNNPTVGIRIPNHELALKILEKVNKPLLVTSANVSGLSDLISYKDVYNVFNGKIASLIMQDATNGKASTVVNLTCDPFKILRKGPIQEKDIIKAMEE